MKKILLACVTLLALSGCSAVTQQAITGYESAALVGIKSADDNAIIIWQTMACGTPYSAILRHPDLWDVMPKLCAAGARENTPSSILSGAK